MKKNGLVGMGIRNGTLRNIRKTGRQCYRQNEKETAKRWMASPSLFYHPAAGERQGAFLSKSILRRFRMVQSRATPLLFAACITALATAGATLRSKASGRIRLSESSVSGTSAANA